jgi:predicted transcriptional regulator
MITRRRITRHTSPATAGNEIEQLLTEVLARKDINITRFLAEAIRQQLVNHADPRPDNGRDRSEANRPEPLASVKATRDSTEIIADILSLGEVGKTRIKYEVGLDHGQTERYLSYLLEAGFLEVMTTGGRNATYRPSRLGLELLRRIEAVEAMLNIEKPRR